MNYNLEKSQWLISLPEKYRPNSVQKIVALSNEDTRHKVFFGNRASGRSYMLLLEAIYEAMTTPNIRIALLGLSRSSASYLMDKMRDIMVESGLGSKITVTTRNPSKIELDNGTIIYFFSSGMDFRGHRLNRLYIDNLEHIKQYDLEVAIACTILFEDRKIVANCIANNPPEHAIRFTEGLLRGN